MRTRMTLALLTVLALALPSSVSAHVTLQPDEAVAGDFTVLDVRVPNERDDAATTKVDVRFPPGFAFASYQPVPGWSVEVKTERPAGPLTSHGEKVTEQIDRMIWTADGPAAGVQPGQFQDLPISVQIPDRPGGILTFKALQTYDDGEAVRWIGAAESEKPAPRVTVSAGGGEHGEPDGGASASEDTGASKGLGIAALILGALGLLAAGVALVRSRRTV